MSQTSQACEVEVFVFFEEGKWEYYCPAFTMVCCGETEEEAALYCEEDLASFFLEVDPNRSIEDRLRFNNWDIKYEPVKTYVPPVKFRYAPEEMQVGKVIRSFKTIVNIPY